jgi:2'-5' RNA ligase
VNGGAVPPDLVRGTPVPAPPLRLFVAVPFPAAVRDAVEAAAAPLRSVPGGHSLRWTDPSAWHLTLAFLGSTDPALVDRLVAALGAVAGGSRPFGARLREQAGRSRSGVLWVELVPSAELTALAAAVAGAVRAVGLPAEQRPYRPHLTFARARRGAPVPREVVGAYAGPAASWEVGGFVLLRSHLGGTGKGPRYVELAGFPLTAAGA